MPAFRAWISKFALLPLCVLLSACDRHNEFGQPDEFPVESEEHCVWKKAAWAEGDEEDRDYISTAKLPGLFRDSQFTNSLNFLPDTYSYDSIYTSYLNDTFTIELTDRIRPSQFPDALPSLRVDVNGELLEIEDELPTARVPLVVGKMRS